MRYETRPSSFGSVYEDELKSFNLIKVPNVKVSIVEYDHCYSTDDEIVFDTDNYYYVYNTVADEFMNIIIKMNYYYNGYYDLMSVYNSILASQITSITVTYNGVDEVE